MKLSSLALPLALAALGGCGDEATTVIDVGPTGPPALRFAKPSPADGVACASIGEDANTRVPLLVAIEQVELRPPLGCDTLKQCGHLVLFVDGVLNNATAVPAIDLLVFKLGDPYHDGSIHAGTGEPDVLELTVQVFDDDEEPLLDRDGEPLLDSLELVTVVSCDDLESQE